MSGCTQLDYGAVFDATPGPYLVLSPELSIMDANRAYLSATMTAHEALVGRHLFEAFPDNPADPAADGVRNLRASFDRVLQRRLPHAMPVQKYDIRGKEGDFEERFWDPVNVPVIADGDRVVAIIHHVTDVTTRMQWRAPHLTRLWLDGRPVRDEELPGMLAAGASQLMNADRTIKRTQNIIHETERQLAYSRRLVERSKETIGRCSRTLSDGRDEKY